MTLFAVTVVLAVLAAARGTWSPCGLSMLSSLNPVSERARGNRFWLTAVWYLLGALAGGALLGAGLAIAAGATSRVPSSVAWAIAGGAALVAVASDTAVVGRSLPDHPRQVDERWLVKYRRWIYAGGYGVQIGAGFATYIMTAAVYLTAVLAMLTGSPRQAFVLALVFGGVRGASILAAAGARTPERLRSAHRRLAALAGPSLVACVVAEAGVALVAAWSVAGGSVAGAVASAVAGAVVAGVVTAATLRRGRRPAGAF